MIYSLEMDEYRDFINGIQKEIEHLSNKEGSIIDMLSGIKSVQDVDALIFKSGMASFDADALLDKISSAKEGKQTDYLMTLGMLEATVAGIRERISNITKTLEGAKGTLAMSGTMERKREEIQRLNAFARSLK